MRLHDKWKYLVFSENSFYLTTDYPEWDGTSEVYNFEYGEYIDIEDVFPDEWYPKPTKNEQIWGIEYNDIIFVKVLEYGL